MADSPDGRRYREALWQALYRVPEPDEIDAVTDVRQAMGVPPWPWVAPALVGAAFPLWHTNSRLPPDQRRDLGGVLQMVATATTGRLPTGDGALIRRHVDWWYRRKIKHPPEQLRDLEREELERARQQTTARRHSVAARGTA